MTLRIPTKVPEPGFYYHYKHDPAGPVNNYTYEFIGVGFHTEEVTHFVIYRPLYDASVSKAESDLGIPCFDARPLEMWMGEIEKDGKMMPRFRKITNPSVIVELEKIKAMKDAVA